MSTISASTTSTTAYKVTADTTGTLVLQTGSTPTTAVTVGSDQSVTFAQAANLPNTFGFKNRIINGAMVIDQRNAGASVNVGAGLAFPVDRFNVYADVGSGHTAQRSNTAPAGFINSLLFTVGTGASPGTSGLCRIAHNIEGLNIADLGWGTSSAQSITLSLWVRTSITGTHSGAFINNAGNRSYAFTFVVNSANTWEYKTITIAGDTSGTWLTDNNTGILLRINLGSGTNSLQAAGSWGTGGAFGATGSVQLIATSGATFYITGVQLEKGSTATSFDFRDYGRELILCQRYFEKSFEIGTAPANGANSTNFSTIAGTFGGCALNGGAPSATIQFKVQKRAAPTITGYGNNSGYWLYNNTTWNSLVFTPTVANDSNIGIAQQASSSIVAISGHWTASSEL